jgi:hypothetical protein
MASTDDGRARAILPATQQHAACGCSTPDSLATSGERGRRSRDAQLVGSRLGGGTRILEGGSRFCLMCSAMMPYRKPQLRRPCHTDEQHDRSARQGCCEQSGRNRDPTSHGEEVDLNRASVLDDEVDQCDAKDRRHSDCSPRSADPRVAYAGPFGTRRPGSTPPARLLCRLPARNRRAYLTRRRRRWRRRLFGIGFTRRAQFRIGHERRPPTRSLAHTNSSCDLMVTLVL